jgi:hypothetical protein
MRAVIHNCYALVAFQPMGDVTRELAFAHAAGLQEAA